MQYLCFENKVWRIYSNNFQLSSKSTKIIGAALKLHSMWIEANFVIHEEKTETEANSQQQTSDMPFFSCLKWI